jgi:cathepsin F
LEGVYQLKGNPLTKLSVEQIVDCDGSQSESGDEHADCGVYGGWPYLAFEFVKRVGGIASERDYPYCVGTNKPCMPCEAPGYNKTKCGPPIPYCSLKDSCQAKLNASIFVPNLKVADWKLISQNETAIAVQMMNFGPLSIALNAELLQFYHKGIFNPFVCDPTNLDHAVLLVGWGVENSKIHGSQPYWIVKNSWGTSWGEQGYFRILRGKGKCGVNTQVTTAILE